MGTTHWQSHLHIGIAPKSTLARILLQKKSRVAAERDPHKRAAFQEAIRQVDPKNLVFLDEAGFSLALHLLFGWGPTKERLVEAVPWQRGVNLSVLGAFGLEGMITITRKAGAMKRVDVEAFLRADWLPRLLPVSCPSLARFVAGAGQRAHSSRRPDRDDRVWGRLLAVVSAALLSGLVAHRVGVGLDQALCSSSLCTR